MGISGGVGGGREGHFFGTKSGSGPKVVFFCCFFFFGGGG